METIVLISTALPWLFILACPLAMWWMMRGMGGGGHGERISAPVNTDAEDELRRLRARLEKLESDTTATYR